MYTFFPPSAYIGCYIRILGALVHLFSYRIPTQHPFSFVNGYPLKACGLTKNLRSENKIAQY